MVVGGLAYTGDVESTPHWYTESLAQVKAQRRKTAYMIFYKSTITRFVRDFSNSSIFVPLSVSVYILVWPFSFFKRYRSQRTCMSPSITEIIIIAPHANVLLSTGAEFDSCSKCTWSKFVVFTFYMGIHPKLTIWIIAYLVMEKSLSEYFSENFQRCFLMKQSHCLQTTKIS